MEQEDSINDVLFLDASDDMVDGVGEEGFGRVPSSAWVTSI
jgi:hypothetical protein